MYAVVFAGVGRRVNGSDGMDLGLPRRTFGAPRNDRSLDSLPTAGRTTN
jgi:hypothetical protein